MRRRLQELTKLMDFDEASPCDQPLIRLGDDILGRQFDSSLLEIGERLNVDGNSRASSK